MDRDINFEKRFERMVRKSNLTPDEKSAKHQRALLCERLTKSLEIPRPLTREQFIDLIKTSEDQAKPRYRDTEEKIKSFELSESVLLSIFDEYMQEQCDSVKKHR